MVLVGARCINDHKTLYTTKHITEDGMGKNKRFDIFFEKHIGFGIRWDDYYYSFHLSIAMPFITINIGIGEDKIPDISPF